MYAWTAIYNDGTFLSQFKEEKEILFKDIDQEKLIAFEMGDGGSKVRVDLKTGVFKLNDNEIKVKDFSGRDEVYRLIYFRRNTVDIGTAGNITDRNTDHYIGLQFTDETEDGEINKKAMISDSHGNYTFHFN